MGYGVNDWNMDHDRMRANMKRFIIILFFVLLYIFLSFGGLVFAANKTIYVSPTNTRINPPDVIGVEWDASEDTWRHIDENGKSLYLVSQDFDHHPIWGQVKRCNMNDAGTVACYSNDPDFSETGSNGKVMVEIPRCYVYTTNPSTNVYRWWISSKQAPGFKVHPAFRQSGDGTANYADYIYVGAYEAGFEHDSTNDHYELQSQSGVQPWTGGEITDVSFDGGQNVPVVGDLLDTSTDTDYYVVDWVVDAGTWAGNDASGSVWLRKPSDDACGFANDEDVTNDTQSNTFATINGSSVELHFDIEEAREYAQNIGSGWNITDIWQLSLIRLLYLIEYKSADSQSTTNGINNGIVGKVSGTGFAGELTAIDSVNTEVSSNGTGYGDSTSDETPMSYRNIENIWGNIKEFIDGFDAIDASYDLAKINGTSTLASPLVLHSSSTTAPITTDGWGSNILWETNMKYALIPSAIDGTTDTYLCDYFMAHDSTETNILLFGGGWDSSTDAGINCLDASTDKNWSNRKAGARLSYLPPVSDYLSEIDIDTFSELDTIVADKTLLNAEDIDMDDLADGSTNAAITLVQEASYDATVTSFDSFDMDDLSDGSTNAAITLVQEASYDLAYTHILNDGSDHSYINQSVISGSSPTFNADNFSDGGTNAIISTTQEASYDATVTSFDSLNMDDLSNGSTNAAITLVQEASYDATVTSFDSLDMDDLSDGSTNAAITLVQEASYDLAYTHILNDGSDHSYINQSVISGSSPTFNADNFSDGGTNAIISTTQEASYDATVTSFDSLNMDDLSNGSTNAAITLVQEASYDATVTSFDSLDMDDLSDGSTNAAITLVQEASYDAAVIHSEDNTQAHSDYVTNNTSDVLDGSYAITGNADVNGDIDTSSDINYAGTLREDGTAIYVSGADPDVSATKTLGVDTDDFSIRGYDGSAQFIHSQKWHNINAAINNPLDLGSTDASADIIIWTNRTSFDYIIKEVYSMSRIDDDVAYTLKEWNYADASDGVSTISAITISDDGTGDIYHDETTGLTHTIEPTNHIVFDNDTIDNPYFIHFTIKGYFDGDVD